MRRRSHPVRRPLLQMKLELSDMNFVVLKNLSLHRQQEWLLESFGDPAQEAGRIGAVNQAVIVRKRKRQNQARLEFAVDPLRLHARARKAEDRDFRDD